MTKNRRQDLGFTKNYIILILTHFNMNYFHAKALYRKKLIVCQLKKTHHSISTYAQFKSFMLKHFNQKKKKKNRKKVKPIIPFQLTTGMLSI